MLSAPRCRDTFEVAENGFVRAQIAQITRADNLELTADLWSTPQLQDEWSRILAISKGRRTAVLHYSGAVEILYPQFERPTGVYFTPGLVSPRQAEREAARIESADVVVLQYLPGWEGFALAPGTERALTRFKHIDFKQIDEGVYFSVYERR